MAKTISLGYTDTAIAGNPAMTMTVGKQNFASDWKVLSETPTEVILSNVTCPTDQPELARISAKPMADIYARTGVDASGKLGIKNGSSVLIELSQMAVETDDTDASYRKYIPVTYGVFMRVPAYGNFTAAMAQTGLLRALGLTNETGLVTTVGVNNLLHGILKKADI